MLSVRRRKIPTAEKARSQSLRWPSFLALALAGAGICAAASTPVRAPGQLGWAVADFDGDSQPDLAVSKMETRSSGVVYWLELDLSTNRKSASPGADSGFPALTASPFGLHLTPRDVDGDHNLDLVATVGVKRKPVAVWINDGRGRFAVGDLAAYPALTPAEELYFVAPANSIIIPVVYDEGRRSRFGLPSGLKPLRSFHPRHLRLSPHPDAPVARLFHKQAPVRAPPSCT